MPTPLNARAVADYFLSQVDEEAGDNFTSLKLQKLVYYFYCTTFETVDGLQNTVLSLVRAKPRPFPPRLRPIG